MSRSRRVAANRAVTLNGRTYREIRRALRADTGCIVAWLARSERHHGRRVNGRGDFRRVGLEDTGITGHLHALFESSDVEPDVLPDDLRRVEADPVCGQRPEPAALGRERARHIAARPGPGRRVR